MPRAFTSSKRAVIVGGDPRPHATARIQEAFDFAHVAGRRTTPAGSWGLADRIRGGTVVLVMPYVSFHARFPQIGVREYRMVMPIVEGQVRDELLFIELYCDEPGCDCRRVLVHVHSRRDRERGRERCLADLSYGWENEAFYRAWAGYPLREVELHDLKGPAVRRLTHQSDRAEEMLRHFQLLLRDPDYQARLKHHYAMFRAQVDAEETAPFGRPPLNRAERRRARKRGGRRSVAT